MPVNFNKIINQYNKLIINNDDPFWINGDNPTQNEPMEDGLFVKRKEILGDYEEYMFIRNSSLKYLSRVLMLESEELTRRIAILGYNFTYGGQALTEESYLTKARNSMSIVESGIVDSVKSAQFFELLVEQLISTTGYTNIHGRKKDSLFRDRKYTRVPTIPLDIYYALDDALAKLGQERLPPILDSAISDFTPHGGLTTKVVSIRNEESIKSLEGSLEGIRKCFARSFEISKDRNESLNEAISGLYKMFNAWLVEGGNSSRCMIMFNAVLKKLGYKPVSHGVIDFAAYIMDSTQFTAYVRYVVGLHQ